MQRREFLATTGLLLGHVAVHPTAGAGATASSFRWAPETGLFESTVGPDPADQLRFAAEHGFTAFLDDRFLQRSPTEQESLVRAADRFGVRLGPCRGPALTGPLLDSPTSLSAAMRVWLSDFRQAAHAARQWGLPGLRIEISPAASAALTYANAQEWGTLAAALQVAADHYAGTERNAPAAGPLLLEPGGHGPDGRRAWRRWTDLVADVDRPGLRLSADVYRCAAAGLDVLRWLDEAAAYIGHVELADFPGGLEPGSGRLEIVGIHQLLRDRGYSGLIGLRHGGSRPGAEVILTAYDRLSRALHDSAPHA